MNASRIDSRGEERRGREACLQWSTGSTDDPESLTAAINQLLIDPAKAVTIRGLSLERGITVRKGRCHVEAALPGILEDSNARLSGASRLLLAQLKLELEHLQSRIEEADEAIRHNGPNTGNRN